MKILTGRKYAEGATGRTFYFHRRVLPPSVGGIFLRLLSPKAPDITQSPTCALFCLARRVSKSFQPNSRLLGETFRSHINNLGRGAEGSPGVEGSLHVHPRDLPRSNWIKPAPNARTYCGRGSHRLPVRVSRSSGLPAPVPRLPGKEAPAPESPSLPRGVSLVRPAERPLPEAHPRPSRPARLT